MGRKAKKEVLEDLQEKYRAQDAAEDGGQDSEAEKKVLPEDASGKNVKSKNGAGDWFTECCCDLVCDEGCGWICNVICDH